MPRGNSRAINLAFAALFLTVTTGNAAAQNTRGFFASAGVSVDQGYESNLFATPDGQGPGESDRILRVGPSVEAGYRSPRLEVTANYTLGTERYGENTSLSRSIGQQDARGDLIYFHSPRLSLGGSALYVESYSPNEIITGDALVFGRMPANRLMLMPAMTYTFRPGVSLAVDYEFSREALADEAAALIHTPHIGFNWSAGPLTTWRVLYRARRFGPPGAAAEMSQTWLVGWERSLGRFAEIELQGGPRLFDGEVTPEFAGIVRKRFRRGEFFLSGEQRETSMLGERGILNIRSLRAGTTLNLARYVKFTAAPTLFRTWRGEASATVRGIDVDAEAYLARGVSLFASGFVADQRGNFGGPLETIPSLSARMGIRVLFPGRPRIDLFRETDEALQREDDRRPGVRAR